MKNLASLDGVPFRINPQSVSWNYSMKYSVTDTLGGRVIQLFGVVLGDLNIEGVFGSGGAAEQQIFVDRVSTIMKTQSPRHPKANPAPVKFVWPDRRWDFTCYVRSITQPGLSTSVGRRNEIINPGWRIVLFIQQDNQEIIQAVKDAAAYAYINRLTAGMGWKQTSWNGPTGTAELQDALHGQTLLQALLSNPTDQPTLDVNQTSIGTDFNGSLPDSSSAVGGVGSDTGD